LEANHDTALPADRPRPVIHRSVLTPLLKLATITLALAILALCGSAQTPPPDQPADQAARKSAPEQPRGPEAQQTFTLHYATGRDLNDVQTALRNMLPRVKIYGVATDGDIVVHGTPEDVEAAKKLIAELDQPRKAYRVTFTLTDSDNGQRSGPRHIALVVLTGQKTTLKQGNRVPLITGMQQGATPSDQNEQVQYIDLGTNIDTEIDGTRLRTKFEQTAISDEKSGLGAQDPVVRQTMLEGSFNIEPGKTVVLGSIDISGSTQHREIAVTVEPLP
jgi:type II secretory pathway component GspD/PulD (secretin)